MKITLVRLIALASVAIAAPLSAQDHGMDHHKSSGWKELDAFHTLLAATWHPAGVGDYKPIRAKADSLSMAAKTWGDAKVPTACDSAPLKAAIADVVSGAAKVQQLVAKNAADAEVRAALHDVHERFEVVEKGCKLEPKHH